MSLPPHAIHLIPNGSPSVYCCLKTKEHHAFRPRSTQAYQSPRVRHFYTDQRKCSHCYWESCETKRTTHWSPLLCTSPQMFSQGRGLGIWLGSSLLPVQIRARGRSPEGPSTKTLPLQLLDSYSPEVGTCYLPDLSLSDPLLDTPTWSPPLLLAPKYDLQHWPWSRDPWGLKDH